MTTNQFKPAGQVNDFSPSRFMSGITPAGTSRATWTSPIRSSSFQYAIPPFAYPNNPGINGGLSLGLAFLSDIQVFMFMEAAQGDRRTNVMQAPKLTLHNGQNSTITIQNSQFFVANVNVHRVRRTDCVLAAEHRLPARREPVPFRAWCRPTAGSSG